MWGQLSFINSSTGATFSLTFNSPFLDLPFPCVHISQIMNMFVVAGCCPVLTQSTCARRETFFSCSQHVACYYYVPFSFQSNYLAKNAASKCVYLLLYSFFSSLSAPPNDFGIC